MGLGNRNARRHETVRTAGVDPSAYWDFKPGQTVMTADGFLGKVEAVNDGPVAGTEEYQVTLHNGLGGGIYTASQLRAASDRSASAGGQNTASIDYPELAEVLTERPDPGKYPSATLGLVASLQTQAGGEASVCSNGHLTWGGDCPACKGADTSQNAMVVNPGDHKPQDVENVRNASLKTAEVGDYVGAGAYDWYDHDDDNLSGEDDDYDEEPERTCPLCGNLRREDGTHPYNGEGPNFVCPNSSEGRSIASEREMARLEPEKYCSEHCQSAHATDLATGFADHEQTAKNEAQGTCRNCGQPIPGSPLHVLKDIGSPQEEHFLKTNPTGPTKYSSQKTAQWYYNRSQVSGEPIVHAAGTPLKDGRRGLDVGDHVLFDSGHSARINAVTPNLLLLEGHSGPMHRGPIEGDFSKTIWDSNTTNEAGQDVPGMSEEQKQYLDSNQQGPTKYSAFDPYQMVVEAGTDPDFRFHITAAWSDVRNKAKRIRSEGGVKITTSQNGYVIATVKGDHNVYEAVLMRVPGTQKVGQWDCGCKWASYHWGAPSDHSRFAGRMCSHALALHFEAQARGMFGRDFSADGKSPRWLKKNTPVVVHYDIDTGQNITAKGSLVQDLSPIQVLVAQAVRDGEDLDEIGAMLAVLGSVNSPFGEPSPHPTPAEPGPTMPRMQQNPASAGFLTAADPEGWGEQTPGQLGDRISSLDDALFEPEMSREAFLPLLVPAAEALMGAGEAAGAAGAAAGAGEAAAGAGEAAGAAEEGGGAAKTLQKVKDFGQGPAHQVQQHEQQSDAEGDAALGEQSQMAHDTFAHPFSATLHDEPEPALPSTDGAAEDEDETTWSGYAGDPEPDRHQAAIDTGVNYSVPSDPGQSGGSLAPNSNMASDPTDLEPDDPSIVSTGSVEDIVAQFQRTAGASALMTKGGPQAADGMDIAAAANAYLAKTAMADFSPAQQQELINEGEHVRAANLDRLSIEGTHYEALEAALGDDDDEGWLS